jgi:hypothetical protein
MLTRALHGIRMVWNRHPAVVLAVLAMLAAQVHFQHAALSWHYFLTGAHVLLSPGGLHVYASHPELQIGPLALVAAVPLALLPPVMGMRIAVLVMIAIGVATLCEVHRLVRPSSRRARTAWWTAAVILTVGWSELAVHYGHLDDALALYAIVLGLRLWRDGNPYLSAIALALAVDAKPWAVPLVAVVFLSARRLWLPLLAVWSAVVAVAWLPFVIADPQTVAVAHYAIPVETASTLHLLAPLSAGTPAWCRPAQLAGGLVLALVAVAFRRWSALLLGVFVIRLALDPSVKTYYDIELLLATAIVDLTLGRDRIPWLTAIAAVTVYGSAYAFPGSILQSVVRTAGLVGLLVGAVVLVVRSSPDGEARPRTAPEIRNSV